MNSLALFRTPDRESRPDGAFPATKGERKKISGKIRVTH
jgi:hypothetical protein